MTMFGALNPRLRDWRGRRCWILGASSGIGLATASALHEAGATIYVSARNDAALDAFAASHPRALPYPLDSTEPLHVKEAAQTILASGPLDLAVYCAGHYCATRATDYDLG